jgi:hypothetical protein
VRNEEIKIRTVRANTVHPYFTRRVSLTMVNSPDEPTANAVMVSRA